MTDFDSPPREAPHDDYPTNATVAPWEEGARARIEGIYQPRHQSALPTPQSAFVRSSSQNSPFDMSRVTAAVDTIGIAAPVLPSGRSEYGYPPYDFSVNPPDELTRRSRAPTPERVVISISIPLFDGNDRHTRKNWTRKMDWKLATMYAENRPWTEICLAFGHLAKTAAPRRWKEISEEPEYSWAKPERLRRLGEENKRKKRIMDEMAEEGSKPIGSGGGKKQKR